MARMWRRWETVLVLALGVAAGQAACGPSGGSAGGDDMHGGAGGSDADAGPTGGSGGQGGGFNPDPNENPPDDADTAFVVEPSGLQIIDVDAGASSPTVEFSATVKGQPINVAWSVDRGDIGAVGDENSNQAVFTPTGRVGGLVTLTAGLSGKQVERQVLVRLRAKTNGADVGNPALAPQIAGDIEELKQGGGIGGVGGEGLGPAIVDTSLVDALESPTSDGQAEGLELLYPYDKTVWPRGLLAPLLMWRWDGGDAEVVGADDADAIRIELETTSGSFSWQGLYARPEILEQPGTVGKFIRHPIPQDIWEMATNSAGGPTADSSVDKLNLRLTIAKDGKAYGPISQAWTIAPARLSGIIYYNSYGTQLAKNFDGAVGGDKRFGGAVLSIRVGDTGPELVAGSHSTVIREGCRVCHSVAPNGSRLIVQGPGDSESNAYDLDPHGSHTAHVMTTNAEFAGIYPDGSKALTVRGRLLPLPDDSTELPISGLADIVTKFGPPKFSADGKKVALNPVTSPTIDNPNQKLIVVDFDETSGEFSDPVTIADYSGQPNETRPGWPAFFPDGNSVAFHRQTSQGNESNNTGALKTRRGAKAQIHWTSITDANHATALNWLNGLDDDGNSYLPKLKAPFSITCTADSTQVGQIDNEHADDANHNYEPTISPIPSGGYAWVVFTSRRMYGNVATLPPFCSDPRGVDLIENVTTKKLWVAAVDLSAKPGEDGSHPAFYLPGQELLAGNSQGFWVFDPCKADGENCESGDQCCGGFCRPSGEDGALVCSEAPPDATCSEVQERCEARADCCDPTHNCINGFCAQPQPK